MSDRTLPDAALFVDLSENISEAVRFCRDADQVVGGGAFYEFYARQLEGAICILLASIWGEGAAQVVRKAFPPVNAFGEAS